MALTTELERNKRRAPADLSPAEALSKSGVGTGCDKGGIPVVSARPYASRRALVYSARLRCAS